MTSFLFAVAGGHFYHSMRNPILFPDIIQDSIQSHCCMSGLVQLLCLVSDCSLKNSSVDIESVS